MTINVSRMVAILNRVDTPSEIGDSDKYNQLELRRATQNFGGPSAPVRLGNKRELLRVLIVDDYRDAADALSMLIEAWGHDVQRAYDGPTGLALAAAHRPHVLLFDIAMPYMSGLEFLTLVRCQSSSNDCLMVALTGFTDAGRRQRCAEAGVDLYFVKPLDPGILKALLTWRAAQALRSVQYAATLCKLPQFFSADSRRPKLARALSRMSAPHQAVGAQPC